MLKRLCLSFVVAAIACGGKEPATSPSPTAPTITTFSLSGSVITSFTLVPIAGATLSIVDGPDTGKSARTDTSGNFTFTGLQQSHFTVNVSATNYFSISAPVTLPSNAAGSFFLIPTGRSIVLTGKVTNAANSSPISAATVRINGRYSTTTDTSGTYSVTGFLDLGDYSITYVFAEEYDSDVRYIRGTSQNVRLHRTEWIVAGVSKTLTVTPDDTLCSNNLQDPSFGGPTYVCRSVRVVAPSDGVMTVEAVSTQDRTHPPLEVETVGGAPCCFERMANPVSIPVTAGTEVLVNVEMASGSTTSQSFTLTTSMTP